MIDINLVDEAWLSKYPPALSERLKELLDDPDG